MSQTEIFARPVSGGRQGIIYSMQLKAAEDLAMILPLPVAQPAADEAVQFVSLKSYPQVFAGLRRGFRPEMTLGSGRLAAAGGSRSGERPLRVIEVGDFAASFVPTVRDFDRLDEQFRLPPGVWEKLGDYASYGFAVFKLKKGHTQVHPMAFVFPTAIPDQLFFPTVHVHDGAVHATEEFDHTLYCQVSRSGLRSLAMWDESELPAAKFVNCTETQNLVLPERHVFRRTMVGEFRNEDVKLKGA